jgi:hypothetical protein
MALDFNDLDSARDELVEKHPGWRFWYVPGVGHITWCAQPLPTLNAPSPEALDAEINATKEEWKREGVHGG